jgi:hypothetical protein
MPLLQKDDCHFKHTQNLQKLYGHYSENALLTNQKHFQHPQKILNHVFRANQLDVPCWIGQTASGPITKRSPADMSPSSSPPSEFASNLMVRYS